MPLREVLQEDWSCVRPFRIVHLQEAIWCCMTCSDNRLTPGKAWHPQLTKCCSDLRCAHHVLLHAWVTFIGVLLSGYKGICQRACDISVPSSSTAPWVWENACMPEWVASICLAAKADEDEIYVRSVISSIRRDTRDITIVHDVMRHPHNVTLQHEHLHDAFGTLSEQGRFTIMHTQHSRAHKPKVPVKILP